MKFVSENKLLLSLILALFMVALVVLIFTTARNTPAMAKGGDKPFYDIPKGETPGSEVPLQDRLDRQSKTAFIDPIYTERLKEQREGVPTPWDILHGPGMLPSKSSIVGAPIIPGYGKAPKSPYDVMYDPDSPFEFYGQPGRLGEKMREYMNPDDERKKETGLIDSPFVMTDPTPSKLPKEIGRDDDADMQTLKTTLTRLFNAIVAAGKNQPDVVIPPVEGKPDVPADKKADKEK
jgi:hypothetical protein